MRFATRKDAPSSPAIEIRLVVLATIIIGIGIRLIELSRINLWEDEIIAVTHAVQPFGELLVNVIRHDIHPPLYFIQLYLWAFVSTSDAWFVANSISWGVASIGAVWYTAKLLYGIKAGMVAAMTFALLPMAIASSQSVRMYPMLSVLVIVSFYIIERTLVRADASLKGLWILGLFFINLMIIATHIFGMVAVFFLGIYGLVGIFNRKGSRSEILKWLFLYGALAILALPVMASAVLHDQDSSVGASTSSVQAILKSISALFMGSSSYRSDTTFIVGLSLYVVVVFMGVGMRRSKIMTICFLVAPVATAMIIGILIKPMFKAPFFASLGLPFAAIVFGIFADNFGKSRDGNRLPFWHSVTCFALAPALLLTAVFLMDRLNWKSTNYRAAAAMINAEMKPNDVIYVPHTAMFWGIAWYLIGPNWGSPLAVAEPPNPKWQEVYRILGPQLTGMLGLIPRTQSVEYAGVRLVIGHGSMDQVAGSPRIWLVTYGNRDPVPTAIWKLNRLRIIEYRGLQVHLFETAPTGR